eukprot:TRINITY_DN11274_c0_g1_i1.p2 TRINITY_DN11274_c0_g1~~TRINITY_DN11274_c0_g1_i1.p2  ORF type:complete len:301 (+),score=8.44 TRINITY_DN11274_c0_g1_i1:1-903(+)
MARLRVINISTTYDIIYQAGNRYCKVVHRKFAIIDQFTVYLNKFVCQLSFVLYNVIMITPSFVFLLLSYMTYAVPPTPYFEAYGANQLFDQEGQSVLTVNGNDALHDVSAESCAGMCEWMDRQCECCNSFSFQPSTGTCYLKKRRESASDAHSYNADGWQSYKYWDSFYYYNGDLPESVAGYSHGVGVGYMYSKSFVGKGPNQLAQVEGNTVTQSSGVSVKECAELCLQNTCDGFSYNPSQQGGTCYVKKNSASGKYSTVYNSEGWTFYWLEDNVDKCYCTCESDFVCITCRDDGTCDAQ